MYMQRVKKYRYLPQFSEKSPHRTVPKIDEEIFHLVHNATLNSLVIFISDFMLWSFFMVQKHD